MTETPDSYRIVGFQADDYLRLRAVSIKPDGTLIELTGRNRQGKSSILSGIWAAVGGKDVAPSDPIRHGAERANLVVELGSEGKTRLTVTRTFYRKENGELGTTLKVENAEGFRPTKPQAMLDALVGQIALSPSAFAEAPAKEQLAMLQRLVPGVDFAALDAASKRDFAERTGVNRDAEQLRAQADGIVIPEDADLEEVDEAALVAQLSAAGEVALEIEREKARRENYRREIETQKDSAFMERDRASKQRAEAEDLRKRANDLDQLAEQNDGRAKAFDAVVTKLEADAAALPPLATPPDTADIQAQIAAARRKNEIARQAERKAQLREQAEAKVAVAARLTKAIEDRKAAKAKAIADAGLPVEGLELGEDGVMLNGCPFDQASQAEQLEASVAIAAAMNPRLRVIHVKQGAFLDSEAWMALSAFAEKHDMQIFAESVQSNRAGALIIEDGMVAGIVGEEPTEAVAEDA